MMMMMNLSAKSFYHVFLQCSISFSNSLAEECCLNTVLFPALRKLNKIQVLKCNLVSSE